MNKHLTSTWRDTRIKQFDLSQLTPIYLQPDDRYLWRDLPSIRDRGMDYPILLYRTTPLWWEEKYSSWVHPHVKHSKPIVCADGMVWTIKAGTNRYQAALDLGYDSIDGIMCDDSDECAKLTMWFKECDPLRNPDRPYTGAWSYS
jgi:hypothetical protein